MGLDMWLHRRTYVGNKHKKVHEQALVIAKGVDQSKVSEIIEEIGYWRKANAIHKWFVDNVQEGNDDCHEYYVTREQLEELLGIVNRVLKASVLIPAEIQNGTRFENGKSVPIMEKGKVIKDSTVAEDLLPTESGFFFGGTQYDQYYVQDLKDTKKILTDALKQEEGGDFYYQSSW